MARPLLLLLCPVAIAVAGCGDDDERRARGLADGATAPTEAAPATASGGCKTVEAAGAQARRRREEAQANARGRRKYHEVDIGTSCGEITIRLDQKTSPKTAASFAALARSGFYDDTVFHRIVPGFVIQGGDPTGTGRAGPATRRGTTPPPDTAYTKGVGGHGQDRRPSRPARRAASSTS